MLKSLLVTALLALPVLALAADDKKAAPVAPSAAPAATSPATPAATPAADPAPAKTASNSQQLKMTDCNKEATTRNLKGEERKKFMAECLQAKRSAHGAQQLKMTTCNKDATAKKLTGTERKAFMAECLKN